jgi:hypothetical protein
MEDNYEILLVPDVVGQKKPSPRHKDALQKQTVPTFVWFGVKIMNELQFMKKSFSACFLLINFS